MAKSKLSEIETGVYAPPPPSHRLYEVIAEKTGASLERLRRAAARERAFLVRGIPWRRSR